MYFLEGLLICAASLSIGASAVAAPLPDKIMIKDLPSGSIELVSLALKGDRIFAKGAGFNISGNVETITGGYRLHFALKNTRGGDRGSEITVAFPVQKSILSSWWKDYATVVPMNQGEVYTESIPWGSDDFGRMWRHVAKYPVCTVGGSEGAMTVAVPIGSPRCFRLSCDTSKRNLLASFDLGFSDSAAKNPQKADFTVLIYDTDPIWGMRDALDKYYKYYPEYATSRVKSYGAWAVTTANSSKIICPWDFGLKYNETSFAQAKKDDIHNMDCIQYSEPWARPRYALPSWEDANGKWHPQGSDGTHAQDAAAIVKAMKDGSGEVFFASETGLSVSRGSTLNCAVIDKNGGPLWMVEPHPDKKSWKIYMIYQNCDPDITGASAWSDTQTRWKTWVSQFSHAAGGNLDGTYMDSLTPWCGMWLDDYNKKHWAASDLPLSASWETGSPVVPQCFGNFEYIKEVRKHPDVWGNIIFGNLGHQAFFSVFSTVLDAIGIEAGPSYGDSPDEEYRYYRSYSLGKPISWLAYGMPLPEIPLEKKERGTRKSLFYGVHMGACMWEDTQADAPVRNIYRKYEPIIRWFDAARWRPVTRASADGNILVERYGDGDPFFIAVRNPSAQSVSCNLTIDKTLLKPGYICRALLKGEPANVANGKISINIDADDTEVYVIGTRPAIAKLWLDETKTWLDLAADEAKWINWKASVGELKNTKNKKIWLPDDRVYEVSFHYRKPAGSALNFSLLTNTCFVETNMGALLPKGDVKMEHIVVDRDVNTGKLMGPDLVSTEGIYTGHFKLRLLQYGDLIKFTYSDGVIIDNLKITTDGNAKDMDVVDAIQTGASATALLVNKNNAAARKSALSMREQSEEISDAVTKARLSIPLNNAISALDSAADVL